MRSTLDPDPCRYSAHGRRNNECRFIYFFHRRGAIHRQGYPPVISPRRQWLPDTSAPRKRCRHLSISSGWGRTHGTRRRTHTLTRTNLICPLNQIPSFCFSDSRGRAGERGLLGDTYTGKVITIAGSFGVTRRLSRFSPAHHFARGFQSLCCRHPSFTKLLTAKSEWILWVIACWERSNLILSAASCRLWMNRCCIWSCTGRCSVAAFSFERCFVNEPFHFQVLLIQSIVLQDCHTDSPPIPVFI